ncbi:hypothetical protein Pint_01888 [Pistacia integerrima]|uniref:Uncharacterized protein n=1 Tax=Pistacia integerrima TaxID=434235 RepID=A0ACC0ZR32_9ROSI|nr:hypothetical protein Pint_01888 [Pistacia integerrima]
MISMDKSLKSALFSFVLFAVFVSSYGQTCRSYSFSSNQQFSTCLDLPVLNSFLHWNYDSAANTVDIAFRHAGTTSSQWVAWALNPSGQTMGGSQCLVALQTSTGIRAYTAPIGASESMPSLQEANLSFGVSNLSANLESGVMIIFAKLQLTSELLSTNQLWQVGPMNGDSPSAHVTSGDNMRSVATIDFRTGETATGAGSINSRMRKRNIHGVLNAVSWGTLMPIGAMMARYLKVFKTANPAWFYLHIACQASAYIVGVAGWATGLKLGNDNPGIQYDTHRNIGITLFALGTLQMFALLLRPKPDHKYRLYWNIYHHCVGYTVIILSIYNIFEGLDILDPAKKWKKIYIGILIFLGAVAVILEAITWVIGYKEETEEFR